MCRLNCTITASVLKGESKANNIEKHPYVWFVLMLICSLACVIMVVTLLPTMQKRICRIRSSFGKKRGGADEESNLLKPDTHNCKAIQTDVGQPETMESQTEPFCNSGLAPYCQEKLKGTYETNEDKKVVIQTTASQALMCNTSPSTQDLTTTKEAVVQLSGVDTTHGEHDIDLTQSKIRPSNQMADDMDSELNSAPLKNAPKLDPSTMENA